MPPMQHSCVCSNHFLPSCFEVNIRSQITGQKCKRRLKEDTVPSEFDYGREAKKPQLIYQAKIALNDEDMKKLVFYISLNILFSLISAALTCLVVQFNEDERSVLSRLVCFDFSPTSIVFLKKCGEKLSKGIIKQVIKCLTYAAIYLFGKVKVTLFTPDFLLCSDSSFSKLTCCFCSPVNKNNHTNGRVSLLSWTIIFILGE